MTCAYCHQPADRLTLLEFRYQLAGGLAAAQWSVCPECRKALVEGGNWFEVGAEPVAQEK